MEHLKYNQNYLEHIAGDFSQIVLKILQEQFLDTKVIELSKEEKEKIVSELIKNQFLLVEELKGKQEKNGDEYIDFFIKEEIMTTYACWYICLILNLNELAEETMNFIKMAWFMEKLNNEFDKKMIELEKELERSKK